MTGPEDVRGAQMGSEGLGLLGKSGKDNEQAFQEDQDFASSEPLEFRAPGNAAVWKAASTCFAS